MERIPGAPGGEAGRPLGAADQRVMPEKVPDYHLHGCQVGDEDLEQRELPTHTKYRDL